MGPFGLAESWLSGRSCRWLRPVSDLRQRNYLGGLHGALIASMGAKISLGCLYRPLRKAQAAQVDRSPGCRSDRLAASVIAILRSRSPAWPWGPRRFAAAGGG